MVFLELTVIRQLVGIIARPEPERHRPGFRDPGMAGDRCGCCPACRSFVRIEASQGEDVLCPACGRPVEFLEPLGPA